MNLKGRVEEQTTNNQRLAGGRLTRGMFARLLGLDRPGGPARVAAVGWLQDHFELVLDLGQKRSLTLVIQAKGNDERGRSFLANRSVEIWYLGEGIPNALETHLLKVMQAWQGVTVKRLFAAMSKDPEIVTIPPAKVKPAPSGVKSPMQESGSEEQQHGQEESRQNKGPSKVLLGTWNHKDVYADFFAVDALELMPYEPIEAANPFVRISHSDLECHSFMPREKASNLNLVDFPWIVQRGRGQQAAKMLETTLSTDLTEHAVIMGCNARVKEVMDHVLDRDLGKPIIFTNTCLPATTSEDVISVLKRYREVAPVSVISHNRAAPDFDEDMFENLLVKRRLAARSESMVRDAHSLNLIGFTQDEALEELTGALSQMGLRTNTAVLPKLNEQVMDRFERASLNVFLRTSRFWDHFYTQLQIDSLIPSITPAGPYGMAGTRAWLATVGQAMNRSESLEGTWQTCYEPFDAQWRRWCERAQQLSIGLVVRGRDLICLTDAVHTNGAPILKILAEIGFGLEIFVPSADPDNPAIEAALERELGGADGYRITPFHELDGLRQALKSSPVAAVFSNHTFDWRLTEAGKNRISLAHFHKGMAGAVRTARQLVLACEAVFFTRYHRHLARTPMGLRSAVQ